MKILNKFDAVPLYERCAVGSSYTVSAMEDIDDISRYRSLYQYRAVLYVRFSANSADYQYALDNAKHQVIDSLYGEVLRALQSIRTEVYAGEILPAVAMIEEFMTKIQDIE